MLVQRGQVVAPRPVCSKNEKGGVGQLDEWRGVQTRRPVPAKCRLVCLTSHRFSSTIMSTISSEVRLDGYEGESEHSTPGFLRWKKKKNGSVRRVRRVETRLDGSRAKLNSRERSRSSFFLVQLNRNLPCLVDSRSVPIERLPQTGGEVGPSRRPVELSEHPALDLIRHSGREEISLEEKGS